MLTASSSPPASSSKSSAPGIGEITDAERQLARELDVLLAARPQLKMSPAVSAIIDLAKPGSYEAPKSDVEDVFANDAAGDFVWTGLADPPRETAPEQRTAGSERWLMNARRERSKDRLRHTAAWAVTVMIGGAILSVAAYVLLGGWPDYEQFVHLGQRVIQ